MTDKEHDIIAQAANVLTAILRKDEDGNCQEVRLEPNTRAFVDRARLQLEAFACAMENKADALKDRSLSLRERASRGILDDIDLFVDGAPDPNALDANGKRKDNLERGFGEDVPGQGLFDDPAPHDWRIPGSGSVPANIHRGLCQAVRDNPGIGRTKAVAIVASASRVDDAEVKEHWEQLVRNGVLHKNGRGWIAEMPEDGQPDGPGGATVGDLAEARAEGLLV